MLGSTFLVDCCKFKFTLSFFIFWNPTFLFMFASRSGWSRTKYGWLNSRWSCKDSAIYNVWSMIKITWSDSVLVSPPWLSGVILRKPSGKCHFQDQWLFKRNNWKRTHVELSDERVDVVVLEVVRQHVSAERVRIDDVKWRAGLNIIQMMSIWKTSKFMMTSPINLPHPIWWSAAERGLRRCSRAWSETGAFSPRRAATAAGSRPHSGHSKIFRVTSQKFWRRLQIKFDHPVSDLISHYKFSNIPRDSSKNP